MRAKHIALAALPSLGHAVSLSDMTPRAENLPASCETIYTAQIGGCTASDFSTRHCSSTCIDALVALVNPIRKACGNQGVSGENLIVAFLAGVGPEQICPNYNPPMTTTSDTRHQPTHPTIINSPTRAHKPKHTSSLFVDTSSTMTQTELPHKTHKSTVVQGTSTASKATKSSLLVDTSSHKTKTAVAEKSSAPAQNNFGDHSGGGSPFDTVGNQGAASTLSLSATLALLSAAAAFFALR